MKKIFAVLIACFILLAGSYSYGQIRKIPAAVTDSLGAMYPSAKSIEWGDRITVFEATFEMNDHKYQASFNADGNWKRTEIFLNEDELPAAVKDGLEKSKFSDWEIKSYVEVNESDGSHQYRLFAKKNEVQKKYLYFNTDGRLTRDAITL
ncbi:MAG: PepSY-like domain-containing protein [Ferruginibacter sp.]